MVVEASCPAGSRRCLSSRSAGNTRLIPIVEVRALIADHKYVTACLPGAEALLDDSLSALESEFPDLFLRVHRGVLVAIRHIRGIVRRPDGGCAVALESVAVRPPISRRRLATVRRRIARL